MIKILMKKMKTYKQTRKIKMKLIMNKKKKARQKKQENKIRLKFPNQGL